MPKISVIIPVYNAEKYIEDCLRSVLSQSVGEGEYEIICVDDNSSDKSGEILREYEDDYRNVRVISKAENQGVSAARNSGLEIAEGEYIWFLDADDFIHPQAFERAFEKLKDSPDVLLVGSNAFSGEFGGYDSAANVPLKNIYVTRKIYKKQFLNAHGLRFFEKLAFSEDVLFVYEAERCLPSVLSVKEPLYFYRRHTDSVMAQALLDEEKRLDSVLAALGYVKEKYFKGEVLLSDVVFVSTNVETTLAIIIGDYARYRQYLAKLVGVGYSGKSIKRARVAFKYKAYFKLMLFLAKICKTKAGRSIAAAVIKTRKKRARG